MATQLPTITVTDAQAAHILAAYQARYGTSTTAETVAAYRRWLTRIVREAVLAHELDVIAEQHNDARRAALDALAAELPPELEDPVP